MRVGTLIHAASRHPSVRGIARTLARHGRAWRAGVERPFVLRRLESTPKAIDPRPEGIVILWIPEAGIRLHLEPMSVIADVLSGSGINVVATRCHELFSRCPVMEMHHAPHPTPPSVLESICGQCLTSSVHNLPDVPVVDLRAYCSRERRREIRSLLDAAPDNLRSFVYEGVAFGKLALHDLALSKKWSVFDDVDATDRAAWLSQIESCLTSYVIVDELCTRHDVRRLVYFNDYALMTSARIAASKHGVGSTTVTQPSHANIDRQRLQLMPDVSRKFLGDQVLAWPLWRDLALDADQVKAGADDLILKLLNSGVHSHVYSSAMTGGPVDVLGTLGLLRDRRTLVAYTSSMDEVAATSEYMDAMSLTLKPPPQPFDNQIEWLRDVVELVEASDDLQLIVRIHPREGVTKRERTSSQHLVQLRSAFDRPYDHVHMVWPEDPISSYDLATIADAALISWSSVGLEFARMGIPVLASTTGIGFFPAGDFIDGAEQLDDYRAAVLEPRRTDLNSVRLAFRWYWSFALGPSLSIEDAMQPTGYRRSRFDAPIRESEAITAAALGRADAREINRQRLASAQTSSSAARETSALLSQLRRILMVIATGRDVGSSADQLRITIGRVDAHEIELRYKRERLQAKSPLLARLARIIADAETVVDH